MSTSQKILEKKYMKLAFEQANKNIGSTKENPSVGCVVVKNDSVISSGATSLNGRPHAETNALKFKRNFIGSNIYVTLEPCTHYGKTPPCVNKILRKGIKKVYYPISDPDVRTYNKARSFLKKNKINVKVGILKKEALNFYKSYFISKQKKSLPFIDAKIAISKDFFSVNLKNKWITNIASRTKVHVLRSQYDCILSTYKSVNKDNSLLNCRLEGMEKYSPSRVIIDKDLKLKKNLDIFNTTQKIPTYIITNKKDKKKEIFLKSKKIRIIYIDGKHKQFEYKNILMELKKRGFSRILCESGLHTTQGLLKNKLIHNLFIFISSSKLGKNGKNSFKNFLSNLRFRRKEKIKVNLSGDKLYKLSIK